MHPLRRTSAPEGLFCLVRVRIECVCLGFTNTPSHGKSHHASEGPRSYCANFQLSVSDAQLGAVQPPVAFVKSSDWTFVRVVDRRACERAYSVHCPGVWGGLGSDVGSRITGDIGRSNIQGSAREFNKYRHISVRMRGWTGR